MSHVSLFFALLAGGASADGAAPAGKEPSVSGNRPSVVATGPEPVYPADFYTPFQPQTAYDMLQRTPGFLLTEGSSVRGFGGAAGNVLIDGQRPTVKGGGITEVLQRIAASRVERIVLLRGSDAAEAQGQVLVANVVLRANAKGSGNASLTLTHTAEGRLAPSGRISMARALAGWQTSIEFSGKEVRYPTNSLYENRDGAGALMSRRIERVAAYAKNYHLSLSASGQVAGGAMTANLRLNDNVYRSAHDIAVMPVGQSASTRAIAYAETEKSGELGLDWTKRLGKGWSAKLVGLGRIERYETDEDYVEGAYRGISSQAERPVEYVGRATITREGNHAVRPEMGFELAYNRLNSRLDYAEDNGAGLNPVALSNADTQVSETRVETFANVTVRLSKRFNLEAGTALELSRIRVAGVAPLQQSLSYLKPSAALVWSAGAETQVRLGMRRKVDQLDFSDFAASVNQTDGRSLGGNSGLRPARITRLLARVDHRWGKKGGALAVEGWRQSYQGVLGYLMLSSGDQALGAIGDGRQWGVTVQGTLPLDAMLRGAKLTVDGTWRDTRLPDPITGRTRGMDDISPFIMTVEMRHDVPKLKSSWGVKYTAAEQADVYYTNELLHWYQRPTWGTYLETTAIRGVKTTLNAKAVFGADSDRLRSFYQPSRAGFYAGSETRFRRSGAVLSVVMAKSF